MKEILVDANVLISFLTDRNEEQQIKAAELFQAAADREHNLVLHSIAIVEMVHVLTRVYEADLPRTRQRRPAGVPPGESPTTEV